MSAQIGDVYLDVHCEIVKEAIEKQIKESNKECLHNLIDRLYVHGHPSKDRLNCILSEVLAELGE